MNKKIILGIIVVAVVLVGAGWWFLRSPSSPQKYTGPVEKVTIAVAADPSTALVYIAAKENFFKDEGLDVELNKIGSGKVITETVVDKKADLGTAAETPIMFSIIQGNKIKVITTIITSNKETVVVARKDRGIRTVSDLVGKKIGVTFETTSDFVIDTLLTLHGISRNEVELINIIPAEMFDSLMGGKVDAISTWNPHIINSQKKLGTNGITFDNDGRVIVAMNLFTRDDFIEKKPEVIKKVLRALIEAEKFTKDNPSESVKIVANAININEALLKEFWDIYSIKVTLDQSFLLSLEDESRWAIRNKLTDKTVVPNYLNYIYFDALESVKPEAVTIIH